MSSPGSCDIHKILNSDPDVSFQTQRGKKYTRGEDPQDLGLRCAALNNNPGAKATGSAKQEPVVVTVTQKDFAKLPVKPSVAHAGPPAGWVPVNAPVVLYAGDQEQELDTTLLDTPVSIRAVPVEYSWDLGDGNKIVTSKPGEPYPSELISHYYRSEGWYDVTLTTTFAGEFSVDGGEWQDINGTITVTSEPIALYSDSLQSRLVDPSSTDPDEIKTELPRRTAKTEGPQDPEATTRRV